MSKKREKLDVFLESLEEDNIEAARKDNTIPFDKQEEKLLTQGKGEGNTFAKSDWHPNYWELSRKHDKQGWVDIRKEKSYHPKHKGKNFYIIQYEAGDGEWGGAIYSDPFDGTDLRQLSDLINRALRERQ